MIRSFLLLAALGCGLWPGSAQPRFVHAPSGRASYSADLVAFRHAVLDQLTFDDGPYCEDMQFRAVAAFSVAKNGKTRGVELRTGSGLDAFDRQLLRTVRETLYPVLAPDASEGTDRILSLDMILVRDPEGTLRADDRMLYSRADSMPTFLGGGPRRFSRWAAEQIGSTAPDGTPFDGRVVLGLVIEKDGSMSNWSVGQDTPPWVVERLSRTLAEAPRWTPATTAGHRVRIRASLPLLFGRAAEQADSLASGRRSSTGADPTDDDGPYLLAEQMPAFESGNLSTFRSWVMEHLKYPSEAYRMGIEGRVIVTFVIEKDGSLTSVSVLRSPDPMLAQAATEALERSPRWTPGRQDGRAVRVKYTLPIDFRIPESMRSSQAIHLHEWNARSGSGR